MRISDWSSDVCSSDLALQGRCGKCLNELIDGTSRRAGDADQRCRCHAGPVAVAHQPEIGLLHDTGAFYLYFAIGLDDAEFTKMIQCRAETCAPDHRVQVLTTPIRPLDSRFGEAREGAL